MAGGEGGGGGGCAVGLGAVESQSLFGGTFVKLMVFGPGCARMAPRALKFDTWVQNSMLVIAVHHCPFGGSNVHFKIEKFFHLKQ